VEEGTPLTWLGWKQLALGVLASLLTGGGIYRLITTYLNRHKPAAEIHKTTAEALKTQAEAELLEVQAEAGRVDMVARMMGRLDEAHQSMEQLRNERNALRDAVQNQKVELELADYQLQRMYGFIKSKGLHYSDADKKQ